MGGVGSLELCACYVWFSYPPSGREKVFVVVLGGGGGHMIYSAHRMVWLWTSYSRALMPAGSLGHPAGVGIVSRETRLFSLSNRKCSRAGGDGKLFQPPSLLLGIPGAPV